jgi:hypothetical protein
MKKIEAGATSPKSWSKPELKRLNAGAAENGTTSRGDSGTGPGTALS